VLKILSNLEDDPRNWARLACVSPKFSSLIRTICWKNRCEHAIPSVVSDLLTATASAAEYAALYKIAVCCPGLDHAGVLLENSDFGLERELGPDRNYRTATVLTTRSDADSDVTGSDCAWSLYDDLYNDTEYNASESEIVEEPEKVASGNNHNHNPPPVSKRRKIRRAYRSHLASSVWKLSREEGNKLLASRFRGDCLYISDWPGCVHIEEKRNYMLFRGIFKNFKRSRVWRTINDGDSRSKIDLQCAYCSCKQTWDMHSAFCLKRVFGYHDNGEPVVRAYVCENGHVSGAWTEWPLYT
jgi:hypothetical protein